METDYKILFVSIGIIFVALLSNAITGYAPSELRNKIACRDTDGGYRVNIPGTAVETISGKETWYPDRCVASNKQDNGILENYCRGNERDFKEVQCPGSQVCITKTDAGGKKYGSTAQCV